ncbi:MAG: hypothetical protein FWD33_02010 [Alphaproteobacteria bacterium]|nr:hypothetical protein [Alphaproteobacteria bacterium]
MKYNNMMSECDYIAFKINKLRGHRNILFRAFVINYVAILVAWLISLMPMYKRMAEHFMNMSASEVNVFMMDIFGIWKILGAVLFLVPALAIWWEMCSLQKKIGM